jgi:hypothetical protein
MTETQQSDASPEEDADEDIRPITVLKLLLFLVWWFSGIGVGTAFMSPGVIGTAISAEAFLFIILSHFCSFLLIIALIPAKDDSVPEYQAAPEITDS